MDFESGLFVSLEFFISSRTFFGRKLKSMKIENTQKLYFAVNFELKTFV